MPINTKSRRSGALKFGRPFMAGTKPPTGNISRFERTALLGCYTVILDESVLVLSFSLVVNRLHQETLNV